MTISTQARSPAPRGPRRLRRTLTLALGAAVLAGFAATAPAQAADAAQANPGRITVTGQAEVSAAPDIATVTLGATTEAKTAAQAMQQNSRDLTRVFDALKTAGVAARDMQTSGLSLGPRWSRAENGEARKVIGFTASNTVTVRVRKLDALGQVLDALVKAGANNINGLQFGVAKPGALQDEARIKAVKDARRKAAQMAEAAGVKLGRVISISDTGGGSRPQPMFRMAVAESAPVPVAGGEVNFSANVTVTYALDQ